MLHRRSVRLPGHDYVGGLYFVTLCTYAHQLLLGEVVDEAMCLNALGRIAEAEWVRTGALRAEVVLDAFVVMPNHVHALLGIVPASPIEPPPTSVGAQRAAPLPLARQAGEASHPLRPIDQGGRVNVSPQSLGAVVRAYKSAVTRGINEQRGTPGAPVWQRNYHERVVRDEREADSIRRYIAENPLRWHLDRYHPDRR